MKLIKLDRFKHRGAKMGFNSLLIILCSILVMAIPACSQQDKTVLKVGYIEGGTYFLHKIMFIELTEYLQEMKDDNLEIIYEPYAYFTAEWDRERCRAMARDMTRLKDIDLVIAAGPWVIEDLILAGFTKPIVGIHQFDPEATGLVDESGVPLFSNVTVNYLPGKIESDIITMHKLFPSGKIGMLFFPSEDASHELKNKIERIATAFGGEVFEASAYSDAGLYSFFKSFAQIRDKIGVLYLPPLWGLSLDQTREFLTETQRARIPVFSSEGFDLVERGATASNCIGSYRALAKFTAAKILKIVGGTQPSLLPTVFIEAQALSLNLDAADKMRVSFARDLIINAKTVPAGPGDSIMQFGFADVLNKALRENSSLLAIEQTYRKAVAEARSAQSVYYPQVDLTLAAAAAENKKMISTYDQILNRNLYADLAVDQKLFSYQAVKAIDIASKKRALKEADLKQARFDLLHTVILAYLSVLECEDRVAACERIVDRMRDYRQTALTNYQLGLIDTTDIPILDERQVTAKINLFNATDELRISKIVLNVLINRPGEDDLVLENEEFSTPRMVDLVKKYDQYTQDARIQKKFERFLIESGIANSNELKIAQTNIGIQNALISSRQRWYFPEISLRAGFTYGETFEYKPGDPRDAWVLGGVLRFPLFPEGFFRSGTKALELERDGLLHRKDVLRFSKIQDILISADRLATSVATLPMVYYTGSLASSNLETAGKKYDNKEYSVTELLMIENYSSQTELELITDRFRFFASLSDLLHLVGYDYPIAGSNSEKKFFDDLDTYLNR
jgi:outer membrane protein TolC/ABC-type uncharacterized transport system substrate-binding protein